MKTRRRITFYADLNGPHEEQLRDQVAMSPEERWKVFIRMKRSYYGLVGTLEKEAKKISIMRPPWM